MMNLYLIRHGEAALENVDPSRPLTEKGRNEVAKTAAAMKKACIKIDQIWHSTKLRAKQTAEIVAQVLEIKNLVEKDGLKPNDPVAPIADIINQTDKDVAIAGHLPFLAKLVALLATGSDEKEIVKFSSAELVCLEKKDSKWQIRPK